MTLYLQCRHANILITVQLETRNVTWNQNTLQVTFNLSLLVHQTEMYCGGKIVYFTIRNALNCDFTFYNMSSFCILLFTWSSSFQSFYAGHLHKYVLQAVFNLVPSLSGCLWPPVSRPPIQLCSLSSSLRPCGSLPDLQAFVFKFSSPYEACLPSWMLCDAHY